MAIVRGRICKPLLGLWHMCPPNSRIHLAFVVDWSEECLFVWFSEEFSQNHLASWFSEDFRKTAWPYILFGPGLTELDNAGKPAWPQSNIWISIWVDWAPSPLYCGWWACQTSVMQCLRDSLLVKNWREKSNDRWLSVLLKEHLCRLVGACFTFVVCTAYSTAVVHVKDSVSTFW